MELELQFSTREAAQKLGISLITLQRHIAAETFNVPKLQKVGGVTARLWTDRDIENARMILADIKPGRKKKA
jgi:predicted DNA-binding transcriptional regulator AlpA